MAATIERAAENDPAVLRARLADAERRAAAAAAPEPVVQVVEVPVVPDDVKQAFMALAKAVTTLGERLNSLQADVSMARRERLADTAPSLPVSAHASRVEEPETRPPLGTAVNRRAAAVDVDDDLATGTSGPARIMRALAAWPGGLTRAQLGSQARLAWRGGTFQKYVGQLARRGLLDERGGRVYATDAGLAAVGGALPPQTPAEMQEHWRSTLTGGALRLFDELVAAYPATMTRDKLGAAVGLTTSGGTFQGYLGRLLQNDLAVRTDDGGYQAHADLFLA